MGISEEECKRKTRIVYEKVSELSELNAEELAACQYAILILVAASWIKLGQSKEQYMEKMMSVLELAVSASYDLAKTMLEKGE